MLDRPDLDAYLRRIADPVIDGPSMATLQAVQSAHALHIPFENLDIHLGRAIRIDLPSVVAKLVGDERGGYCFEHNTLLAAALRSLDFDVVPLAARVMLGGRSIGDAPLTHMVLAVDVDDTRWLVDAGFGGAGPLGPVPLSPSGAQATFGSWAYRVIVVDGHPVLQLHQRDGWMSLYAVDPQPPAPVDFELMNWWTSTHPSSGFVRFITVQRPGHEVQLVLRGVELTEYLADDVTSTTLDVGSLVDVIRERFGLSLPPDSAFRAPPAVDL